MSGLVVDGRVALPKRLIDAGYKFRIKGTREAIVRFAAQ
jgi:NAD dependent epimerase/dehydratase family enzyme